MEQSSPNRLSWIAALLATALFCCASYLVAWQITSRSAVTLDKAIVLACTPDQQIEPLGDGVLFSDGTYLHALNSSGQQIWSRMAGTGSGFSVGDGGVATWSGTMLSLLDASSGTLIYSGNMEGDIISAWLGASYAAVLVGEENNATLMVLERGGRQVDKISLPSQTVLDYGFFSNGSLLWVMSLDTEGTVPMSSIITYKPGRMLAGTITDSEQVVYRVLFRANDLCAVGTTYAKTYSYAGSEIEDDRLLVYGWYLMDVAGSVDSPLMAFAPMAQNTVNPSVSDVRLVYGASDRTLRMPFPCFAIAAKGDSVYGFHRQYVMVCGSNDTKPTAYALPVEAESLIGLTQGRSAILVSGDTVYLVPLP